MNNEIVSEILKSDKYSRQCKSALVYAVKFGFAVFPVHSIINGKCSCGKQCNSPGKHPRVVNGVKEATKDTNQIMKWWTATPSANIGIACGEMSGIFVLDVDIKEHVDGHDTLRELEEMYGEISETPMQISGSGGSHYIFRHVDNLKNGVEFKPGLDIRTDGGYIMGCPSNHISGKDYTWEVEHHISEMPIADANEWLIALIPKKTDVNGQHQKKSNNHWSSIMQGISKGGRNNAAASLAGHLLRRYVDVHLVCEIMELWNMRNSPPLDIEELECIISSVARTEAQRRNQKLGV